MNYNNPELIEHLASEYVLGTLIGKARLRFERLMLESYLIRRTVWEWEQRLYPMSEGIEETEPPSHLWQAIQQRLAKTQPVKPQSVETKEGLWHSLAFWRSWSSLSSVAAVVLIMTITFQLLPTEQLPTDQIEAVAVFSDDENQPLWLISSNLNTGKIGIRAVNATAAEVQKSFELWMLPSGTEPPRSMGLLPVSGNRTEFTVPPLLLEILRNAQGLAIS